MFWLFAMATTAGVIMGTPVLFQALVGTAETPGASGLTGFSAAALTVGGLGGLLALAFDPTDPIALIVALCLGLAGGAVSPELLDALQRE